MSLSTEQRKAAIARMKSLPPKCLRVVVMIRFEHKEIDEVAEFMHITRHKVMRMYSYATKAIAEAACIK